MVPLARRYNFPDGRFAGIILSPVPLDDFSAIFSSLDIGKGGAISLRDENQSVITRYPEVKGAGSSIGHNNISNTLKQLLHNQPEQGTYKAVVKYDLVERTISYRKLTNYPLYVYVGQSPSDYLASWYKEVLLVMGVLALFTLFTLAATWHLCRRWMHEAVVNNALTESEQRYRELVESSPAGIYKRYLGDDGNYLYVNPSMAHAFHCPTASEFIERYGTIDKRWKHPERHDEFKALLLKDGRINGYEVECCLEDGSSIWISLFCALDATTGIISGWAMDVTERILLQDQLYQSQKMESIGQLAGGVAHDFNNMLSVILEAAHLSLLKVPENSDLAENITAIKTAAERSSNITRQLLAFSRKEIIVPKPIDLNTHLLESKNMLSRLIGEHVTLTCHTAENLWTLLLDPSQLDQILMNLVANARDAMQNTGFLMLKTDNIQVDETYCQLHLDARPGNYVRLTVSDTGHGIERETLKHIFEPFFTTKNIDSGTGLGLATVYGIVTQNKGFITVYSECNRGTEFSVYFPRIMVEYQAEEQVMPTQLIGSETILLVEDEQILLKMTTKILQELGYRVIQAQSPETALEIFTNSAQEIDLVLTDLVMPGMSGREMVDQIMKRHPETKVLFMSGYTADVVSRQQILEEGMFFIQKPLDVRLLSVKIQEVLRVSDAAILCDVPATSTVHETSNHPASFTIEMYDDTDIIELFMTKAPEYAENIRSALMQGDYSMMHHHAHKLKGAAVTVGFHAIARIAEELEAATENDEYSILVVKVDQLTQQFEASQQSLNRRTLSA
ncbi:MAG TPA: response regulator [Desulfuromonadales bacterium]|nr:response regulator [Desulfuromonadales bacterium]